MKYIWFVLMLAVVLSACALTESVTPPAATPDAAPALPTATASGAASLTAVPTAAGNGTASATPGSLAAPTSIVPLATPVPGGLATPSSIVPIMTPTAGGDPLLALAQQFDGAGAYEHVRFLTSDELAGRKAGAPGADKAADYIAERLKTAGLKAAGDNGTYFQTLTLPFIELAEAPALMILNADGSVKRQFKHRLEFSEIISGRAGDGQADGRLVFLGRGTAKDLALAGDIQGTVALIVPAPTTPRDLISSLSAKGVLGIIEVGDAASLLIRYSYVPENMIADGARPLVRASPDVAAELLAGSGATLQELEDRLTRDGAAFVSTPNRVKLSVKLLPVRDATTRNVLAMIPGTDPATSGEVVIVGGHYDHVGADPGGAIFQGANDNASGSAVVVGLAEYFAQKHIQLRYTLVFAAWTGEEAGLVGSMYYTQHPLFSLAKTKGYINLDVVGAGAGDGLTITNDSPALAAVARSSAKDLGIPFGGSAAGGGSDHESFLRAGVPATFFIWQRYGDIHVPGDTFAKIDVAKLTKTGQATTLTLLRLSANGQ